MPCVLLRLYAVGRTLALGLDAPKTSAACWVLLRLDRESRCVVFLFNCSAFAHLMRQIIRALLRHLADRDYLAASIPRFARLERT